MMMIPGRRLLPLALLAAGPAMGQEEPPLQLPGLSVVTASRAEQQARDVLASVSVITREDIGRSVAQDLFELLRLQAGMDIVRTGPAGSQTSVFLRGSNSDHVLVLIDGVRVSSAHTGSYAWELLPLAQIERVEIVRGPRAAVYGSDAIGGVVQIFTRQADAPSLRLSGGSYGALSAEAGLGLAGSASRHSLHAAWRRTDGFSAQNPEGFSFDPDDDGFESASAGINGDWTPGDGALSYRLLASESESEFDQGVSEARQWVAALGWFGQFRPGWGYQLQAGYLDDALESDYGFFATRFTSRRLELGWHNQLALASGRLNFGLDATDESGRSDTAYQASRDNLAAYGVWEGVAGETQLQLGARLDDNSEFGSEWSWQAAAGRGAGASGHIGVLLGTAFRAPDLGEQFSPGFGGWFAGNPDLLPETSFSAELNYRVALTAAAELRLAAYHTEVDQLIAYGGENFQAINIDRAELRGLELEYSRQMRDWTLRLNATLQRTEDNATGEALLRRPERKGSLSLERAFGNGGWAGLDWFASGPRLDVGSDALPGYGVLSLRAGLALGPALTLEARWENVLDKRYAPAAGYNSAGRSAYLAIDWRP